MARSYLYLEEVARECRTSVSSARAWISSGRLRATRPGRRLLVSREDFEKFLESSVRAAKRPKSERANGGAAR
jgi:excisionase family DNA binding protein